MARRRTCVRSQPVTYLTLLRAKDSIPDLVTDVRLTSPAQIQGHVFDPNKLDTRFVVELYVDGQPAALARAELYDDRLRDWGVGDGCYRYAFAVSHLISEGGSSLEVRIANSNRSLGSPIAIENSPQEDGGCFGAGEVQWSGGLRFSGWLSDEPRRRRPEVQVFVDGIASKEHLRSNGRISTTARGPRLFEDLNCTCQGSSRTAASGGRASSTTCPGH